MKLHLLTVAPGHRGSVESTSTVQSHLDAGLMSAITSHRRISLAAAEAGMLTDLLSGVLCVRGRLLH